MTKVVTKDIRYDEVKVGELSTGDFFVTDGDLYVVTDEYDDSRRLAVCLNSGSLERLRDNDFVEKVNTVTISFA